MAGIPAAAVGRGLGLGSVFRAMPNTPVSVGHGTTLAFANPDIVPGHLSTLTKLWGGISRLFMFDDEAYIDRATPVSGSGPAFIFEWARLMQADLEALGIDADRAHRIVVHTFLGSAKLMEQSELNFEQLRIDVTSPGGSPSKRWKNFGDPTSKAPWRGHWNGRDGGRRNSEANNTDTPPYELLSPHFPLLG